MGLSKATKLCHRAPRWGARQGLPRVRLPSRGSSEKTRLLRKPRAHRLGFFQSSTSPETALSGRAGNKDENARTWHCSEGGLAGLPLAKGAPPRSHSLPGWSPPGLSVPPSPATHTAELILQEAGAGHSAPLSGSSIHPPAPRPAPIPGPPSARRFPAGAPSGSGGSGAA